MLRHDFPHVLTISDSLAGVGVPSDPVRPGRSQLAKTPSAWRGASADPQRDDGDGYGG
jgi:hypothetical protein